MVVNGALQDVPAFFKPDAPPPTLPIPIAQTEVGRIHTNKLLAQEELGPNPSHLQSSIKGSSTSTPQKTTPKKVVIESPGSDSGSDSSLSELESDSDSDSDSDNLIPKPDGEAGRPGRGGYNLEEALAWDKREYRRLKVTFFYL